MVFSAEPVKQWLSEAGISIAETVARAALVIPLWKDKTGLEPLDDRNAWRDAWTGLDTLGSSVPVALVRGDQLDQDAITVEQAYVGDVTALSRLDERYRAPVVIVAIAEGDKDGPITVERHALRHADRRALASCWRSPSRISSQLAGAAKQIHAKLDQDWRGLATVRRDQQAGLDVVVPIRALADWVQGAPAAGRHPGDQERGGAPARSRSCRPASRLLRLGRGPAEDAGPGRAAAREGCRQVACCVAR